MLKFVLIIPFVLGVVALIWWAFQALWNYVVAGAFGGPSLSYWQAAALCVLGGWIGSMFRGSSKSS